MVRIKIKKLHPDAIIPKYNREGDAGMDLHSVENVLIGPGQKALISTGISIELPPGYVSLIWGRSGLAAKQGITTLGGVIEHTYRGAYGVILLNTSKEMFVVNKGDRIAQLLIQPIVTAEIEEAKELSESPRGNNAWGSSGI